MDAQTPKEPNGKSLERLRFWASLLAVTLLFGTYLLDIADDIFWGNHFSGPPLWLVGIVIGIIFPLSVPVVISKYFKEKKDGD